jgi:hypothetical protein
LGLEEGAEWARVSLEIINKIDGTTRNIPLLLRSCLCTQAARLRSLAASSTSARGYQRPQSIHVSSQRFATARKATTHRGDRVASALRAVELDTCPKGEALRLPELDTVDMGEVGAVSFGDRGRSSFLEPNVR